MPEILLYDVWKEYLSGGQRIWALRGVSLKIGSGDFVAIAGPSGSGKSTLLYLLSGIEAPTKGSVIVGGLEIGKMSDEERRRWRRKSVTLIFQFFHLIPTLTALENVMLAMELAGRGLDREAAMRALELVGLSDKANRFPWELSGGEQQRVAVARAMVSDAPLVLADEPTAFLDRENKMTVMKLLREINEAGKTVIFTTHDVELAGLADRVIRLSDGQVVSDEIRG